MDKMKNETIVHQSDNVIFQGDRVTISIGYRKGSDFNIKLSDNDPRLPVIKQLVNKFTPIYQRWRDAQHLVED